MTSYIVVFGLIVVVVLVVVLVALGLRASRAGRDDDDWMDDEPQQQPRGRRGVPPPPDDMGVQDDGYGPGYDQGYGNAAPDPGFDRRVAGGPLAAPAPAAPPSPPPPAAAGGPASDEMEDDDYWATITFDKPKFPWQHGQEAGEPDPAADPLNAQHAAQQAQATQHVAPPEQQPAVEQPGLTQPVALGADGTILNGLGGPSGTGPQQVPGGGFQGATPFAADPGSTSHDPIPADLGALGGPSGTGPQAPYGMPDQQVYGGQEPQPAYGAADQYDPSYGGAEQFGGHGDQPHYGTQDQPGYGDQPQYGVPDQPQYGSPHEPSYGDFGGDPLGSRPAAGRPDAYDLPLGSSAPQPPAQHQAPPAADPLGLPLGRTEEPVRGFGETTGGLPGPAEAMPPAPPAPAAHGGPGGAPSGGSGSDTDNHKLPTVDELLQRIQTDRQRSAGGPSGDSGGSYGSLNDPLSDPLGTGSFGTGPGAGSGGGSGTGPWPPPASGGATGSGGGFDGGYGASGTGSGAGYGQGSHTDGYPTAPAYGESPRYDDPLSGGSREPYGSGGQGGGTGAYGDFSGSSYNGGDPLAAPHDPGATQAYGSGYPGSSQQGGYQQGGQPNDGNPYGSRQQPDDWENYRR
ncbi:MAG TPA: hypothetical protein VFV01_41560 [Spirillospora sp.]|nr:hypothetical protein [Spirillospora sp.]